MNLWRPEKYSRAFTADVKWVLRQADRVIWEKEYSVLNETEIGVAGEAVHRYKAPDGGSMGVGKGVYIAIRMFLPVPGNTIDTPVTPESRR